MELNLKMRPVRDEDEPFLRQLREQVDRERLGLDYFDPDDEELVQKIITSQFTAHSHDRKNLNWDHKHCIIELEGEPVGRFVITQNSEEIRLADVEVESAHKGMGIGQAVISATQKNPTKPNAPFGCTSRKWRPASGPSIGRSDFGCWRSGGTTSFWNGSRLPCRGRPSI